MRRFVQAFDGVDLLPDTVPAPLAEALAGLPQRYNIAMRTPAAVLYEHEGLLRVGEFTWGLVPRWSKEPRTKYTTVTARLERAARSRIFRGPWESRRCVVPMNGYYKWDRSAKPASPYFIQARDGRALFAAGLWELWDKQAPPLLSFAVLTQPNDAIPPPLVPDGPVFLPASSWHEWITQRPWLRVSSFSPRVALNGSVAGRTMFGSRDGPMSCHVRACSLSPWERAGVRAGTRVNSRIPPSLTVSTSSCINPASSSSRITYPGPPAAWNWFTSAVPFG